MKIGEVIKKLLGNTEQKQMIQEVVGSYSNALGTSFSRWLDGQGEYPSKYLLKTADFLNISIVDLLGYETFTPKELDELKERMEQFQNPIKEEIEELPFFIKDSIPYQAIDASMNPYIQTGDVCIFQKISLKDIRDGEVVFFNYGENAGIRIFKIKPNGKILLKALNGIYEDHEVTNKRKLKLYNLFKIIREPKRF